MDKDTAIRIVNCMDALFGHANEMLYLVNNCCSLEEQGKYQKVLGMVVAELDLELLEPIYKMFPDLRPADMEELK